MSSTDKQLKALKRRLKEWEAAFLKAHGRKATVQDIAKDPSIESEYKKYKAEKKRLAEISQQTTTNARQGADTVGRKRGSTAVDDNDEDAMAKRSTSVSSCPEVHSTPSSGRKISYHFDSPRIKRRSDSTPTRRRSKVDAFVSSLHENSPSSVHQGNKIEEKNSQGSSQSLSPVNRRQTDGISPGERAKRLLRTPTKLSSISFSSPRPLKSLESVFQEGECNGKHSLLELFTSSSEDIATRKTTSPPTGLPISGVDESVDFFLEGMAESTVTSLSPNFAKPSERIAPRRREKRLGLEGFAPSNSLDEFETQSLEITQVISSAPARSPPASTSEIQSLSPLNFRIARPSFGSNNSGKSPSTAKGEDAKHNIMPGFYSSLASTQNNRRLLISPERRQRLLRQLSDHGSIGNVLLDIQGQDDSSKHKASEESNLDEDNSLPEEVVWKKKPIQKRRTRLYKIPFVEAKGTSNQRHRQASSKNTESSDDSQESEKESAQSDSLESSAPQPGRSVRNTTIDEESAVDHSDLTAGRPSAHSHPDGQNSSAAFAVAKPASKPPKSTRKSKRLNTGPQVSNNFVALRLPSKGRSRFGRRR